VETPTLCFTCEKSRQLHFGVDCDSMDNKRGDNRLEIIRLIGLGGMLSGS
jgi:hypothetical protein